MFDFRMQQTRISKIAIGFAFASLLAGSHMATAEEKRTNHTGASKDSATAQSACEKVVTGIITNDRTLFIITQKAKAENWRAMPIGDVMGKVAKELEGTPYVANTLDHLVDEEIPTVDMNALDCVTFFETTLDLARAIKKGKTSTAALLDEIRYTRYRDGKVSDYTSRLHYTTDWFINNEAKHVVKILVDLPASEPFAQKLDFMSSHPNSYKQLAAHPELIEKMKAFETNTSKHSLKFIPIDKVSAIEPLLKTGDIVGLCTNIKGLDISHTGIIYRSTDNKPHFMDASSRKDVMKVVIETLPISEMLEQNKKHSPTLTGIMIARPLEPR